MENVGSDQAGRAIGQEPLAIGGWHVERVVEEWGGSQKRGGKRKTNAEFGKSAEDAEKREEQRFRDVDRKSPPLETKGGAPVIFQEVVHSI